MRGADGSALFVLGGLMATVAELIVKIGANFGGLVKGFDTATDSAEKWAKSFKKTADDYMSVGKGLFETGKSMQETIGRASTIVNDLSIVMGKAGEMSEMSAEDMAKFGAAAAQAGGSALMLAGSLPNLILGLGALKSTLPLVGSGAAVVATGLAGWEIGTLIRDSTGLGETLDWLVGGMQELADSDARIHAENQRLHASLPQTRKHLDEVAEANKRAAASQKEWEDKLKSWKAAEENAQRAAEQWAAATVEANRATVEMSDSFHEAMYETQQSAKEMLALGSQDGIGVAISLLKSRFEDLGYTGAEAVRMATAEAKRLRNELDADAKAVDIAATKIEEEIGAAYKKMRLSAEQNDPFSLLSQSADEAAGLISADMAEFGDVTEETKNRVHELASALGLLDTEFMSMASDKMGELGDSIDKAAGKAKDAKGKTGADKEIEDAAKMTAAELRKLADSTQRVEDQNAAVEASQKEWSDSVRASTDAVMAQVYTVETLITSQRDYIDALKYSFQLTGDSFAALAPHIDNAAAMFDKVGQSIADTIGPIYNASAGMMALGQLNESALKLAAAMEVVATDAAITDDWMRQLTSGLQAATEATKPIDIFAKAADDAAASAAGTADALDALTRSVSPSGGSAGGQSAASRGVGLGGAVGPAAGLPGLFRGLLGRRGGALGGAGASVSSDAAAGPSGVSAQPVVVVASEAAKRPLNVYLQMSNGTLKAVFADMIDEDRGANIQSRI